MSTLGIIGCERLTGGHEPVDRLLVEPDAQGTIRLRHDENSVMICAGVAV